MNSLLYTLLILSLKGVFMEHEKTISLSPNDRHRQLFFLTKATVALESPDNGTVVATNSMQVDVSYGTSSFLAFLKLFSRVEVLLDTKVVATKGSVFLGLPFPSGQHSFVVDVSSIDDGTHELQAKAYLGFGLLGRTSESEVAIVTIDRTPLLVKTFKELSFIEGYMNDSDESVENYEGVDYDVKANLTTYRNGIVALSGAQSLLESVNCFEDGSVIVTFRENVTLAYINNMFPNTSILAIDGSVFGSCFLGIDSDDNTTSYYTDIFANSTEDGFLFILDVSLQSNERDVLIQGSQTSFLFMFEEADIQIFPATTEEGSNSTGRKLFEGKFNANVRKRFPLAEKSLPPGKNQILQVRSGVDVVIVLGFGWDIKWTLRKGVDVKIYLDYGFSLIPSVGIYLEFGELSDTFRDGLFSYPLLGIPRIKLLKKLKLPEPKLGLYFEVNFFMTYTAEIFEDASVKASMELTTGEKKIVYKIKGRLWDLKVSTEKTILKEPGASKPKVEENIPDEFSALFTLFTGIEPGIWCYLFNIAKAGIYQRTGLEFNAKANEFGLPPAPKSSLVSIGPCSDYCHIFETGVYFRLTGLKWTFRIAIKLDVWDWIPFVPDEIEKVYAVSGDIIKGDIRLGILRFCAIETYDDPCQGECCRPGYSCYEGVCRINIRNLKFIDLPFEANQHELSSQGE